MQKSIINRRTKRVLAFLIINIFMLISLVINDKNSVLAAENNYVSIEKVYSEVDLNDDFDGTSVIVVLNRKISGINKVHDNLFKDVEYTAIEDLSIVTDESTIADVSNFEQILKITLPQNSKQNVLKVIEQLSKIDGVKYAGPNRIFKIERAPNDPFYTHPTTPEFGQWGLNTIQSEGAWNFTTGNHSVRVGIIDTGIASHPDLNANVTDGGDFVNMIDSMTPGPLREDPDGHGTHVAGIVGAVGNQTTPTGVAGVNWNVTLVPMQVANNAGNVDGAACVRAVNFARNTWNTENRISILSMSIGGSTVWPEMETAIREYPGLFICSTGNRNQDNDVTRHYPSFYGSELHTNPLTNMIAVGRSDINDLRPATANFGAHTITLYAPGQEILSTYPEAFCTANPGVIRTTRWGNFLDCESEWTNIYHPYGIWEWVPNGTTHHADGYHRMSGSSMATPFVSGVAALLLSIDPNLTTNQLRTAIINSVDMPNVSGTNPFEGLCVTNGRLNAYNAVKFVLENFSNTTYTLSNYSSTVNANKAIVGGESYFSEKNGFYKLNVTYAKNYEFIISSTKAVDVVLYDDDFNEVNINDLHSGSLKTHFIQNLPVGTYYLRTSYENENDSGTINTKIVSRNTVYLNYNQNDILINTYNGVDEYYYINSKAAGFYEFRLTGTKADGTTVAYPAGAITIYSDSSKSTILDKFSLAGYSNQASTKSNENRMIVYLPRNGYFYIDVNMPSNNLSSLYFDITSVSLQEIDLFDFSESTNELVNIFSETTKGDYLKKLEIDQAGKFTITATYSGFKQEDILFVLTKLNYHINSNTYSLDTRIVELMDADNKVYTRTLVLEDGIYYVGYFNKNDTSVFNVSLNRLVTQYGGNALVTDPDHGTLCGSQISIIEMNETVKSYRQTFITKNFTRLIYPDYNFDISASRLDYYWYSSNESIATVTNYGTVLGQNVGTVKIMAVLKEDPSKVFIKEFTIINDTGTEQLVVNSTYKVKYSQLTNGKFQLNLEKVNCPYPWIQDYGWSINTNCHNSGIIASMNYWGEITVNGTGCFTLTGSYYKNSRVKVVIHVIVEP